MKRNVDRRWISIQAILTVAMVLALAMPAHAAQMAVSATAAADYSSGAHAVISVDPVGGPRTVQHTLAPTISDITVAARGAYFYRMERYMGDNVTKFAFSAPETPIWQFSTLDSGESVSSNPYDLVFADDAKAYLLRFGRAKAWIVNPSATDEAGFKTGELDLSAYADADGVPEMTAGVIVGNRLFLVLQRMDQNAGWVPGQAYVAVFDIATDTEIDTGIPNADGVKGIPLPGRNPVSLQYAPETGLVYVACQGRLASSWAGTPAEYTGGIVTLNPRTFATATLVDDGDDAAHPYGNIAGVAVTSAHKGYFLGYAGWGDVSVFSFDPSTGAVSGPLAGDLAGRNLSVMRVDQNRMVWIGDATGAAIAIVNPATDEVDERVETGLNPIAIAFGRDESFTYYLPRLAAGDGRWTGVGLRNLSSTTGAEVTLTGYGADGGLLLSEPRFLAARGQDALVVADGMTATGWIQVTSSQPLSGLSFVGDTGDDDHMADMPVTDILSKKLIIPHIAQSWEWDTTLMICNPNAGAATVSLTYVTSAGQAAHRGEYVVPAGGSGVYALADMLNGSEYGKGSLEITATQGVAAFAMYTNAKIGGHSHAGITAIPVTE